MSLLTSLVGYWKFDESNGNALDSSGNNNTLTNNNSITYSAGKINNGANIELDNSQFFSIAYANQTGLGLTGDCSFSFWVKINQQPPSTGETAYFFFNKSNEAGGLRAYEVAYSNNSGEYHLDFGKTVADVNDNYYAVTTLPVGSLAHVVITWKASTHTATFYVNNVVVGTSTGSVGSTSIDDEATPLQIGAYVDDSFPSGKFFLDGQMDESGIWAKVLTADEVSILYYGGVGDQYPFNIKPTGGTIIIDGSYTIHKFILDGTLTFYNAGVVQDFVQGGGGGGSNKGGGGGAGGIQYNASVAVTAQGYSIVVGDGGPGGTNDGSYHSGTNGEDSTALGLTGTGGGWGGTYNVAGANGGCGGGAMGYPNSQAGWHGTGSQGYDGGHGISDDTTYTNNGGGGGMGAVGGNASSGGSGVGGAGLSTYSDLLIAAEAGVDISGTHWIGGGGGGGAEQGTPGAGGNGGGGSGVSSGNGGNATANTGGGGGGANSLTALGGNGGSGLVIIRYLTSDFLGSTSNGISMTTNTRFMG